MVRFPRALALFFLALVLRAAAPEFEPNTGQAEPRYLFLARTGAARTYIEDRGLELAASSGAAVRLYWAGGSAMDGNSRGEWSTAEATGNTTYYCLQDKSSLCTDGVRTYRRLLRKDLYPGIDWDLYGRGGQLEYDLVVHPGATIRDVRLHVEGAPAQVAFDGRLRAGGLLHWRPEAYQVIDGRRVEVDAALRATGDAEFEFVIGGYDTGHDLVIDPVVQAIAVAGGSDEDAILGSLSSGSCSYRYGTTRSADWHRLPATGGRHVFVQLTRTGYGTTTLFWGGEGEESIGGVNSDLNNCRLYMVGWTNSQNAPILSAMYDNRTAQPYAGGATDGFLLEVAWGGLAFAGYLGGPGADRIYDVRGYTGSFAFAGETDNTAWAGATARKIGTGGKTDAIVGLWTGTRTSLVAIGGSGNDRAMRLRDADKDFWVVAGETDSPDFPALGAAGDATQAAAGQDLWLGRLRWDLSELPVLRLFGGSGDERFGGLAVLPSQGLYLAGTTTSPDLPAASGEYHGGDSDGFISFLDPLTAVPQLTTYIGGAGRDEIAAVEARDGDVFLGGTTDSNDLALPGLAAEGSVRGGLDALFVLCDAFGAPTRGIRLGGSGDDRVLGIEPGSLGQVTLAGSSDSLEWLRELDPFHADSSGQDGFLATVSFAAVRLGSFSNGPPGKLYLGRDLQVTMSVWAASEEGMDGLVLVRSGDPSRLLVSPRSDLPGTSQILLNGVDQIGPYSAGRFFVLQALADSGEVELLVEGRATTSPKGTYPRQRIRVSLTPTALFLSSLSAVSVAVNGTVDVAFAQAPLLPDGSSGPAEELRAGVTSTPGMVTSDAAGLRVLQDSIEGAGSAGSYRARALALRAGTYTLTPSSSRFPAAAGQSLTVRVGSTPAPVSLFSDRPYILAKDHFTTFSFNAIAGDALRFTSEDPGRLAIGTDANASASTVSLSFPATYPYGNLAIAALAAEGTSKVRVEGTYRGQPIAESLLVRLVPYKAALGGVPEKIGSGFRIYPQVQLQPQTAVADVVNPVVPSMAPRPATFASVQLRSSNPAVLQITQLPSGLLYFNALGGEPGDAVLDFGPGAPAEFAGLRASVQVVPARLEFGATVLRIPAGTGLYIYPLAGTSAGTDTLKAVRLRLSAGAPLTIQSMGQKGGDVTMDFSTGYMAGLMADTAKAGQQATLYISGPGMAEYALPIRIVEAVLVPFSGDMRVTFLNGAPAAGRAVFQLRAYDEGQVVPLYGRLTVLTTLKVRPTTNPAGICETPDTMDVPGNGELNVPFTCSASGATVLALQPVAGVSAAQPQFTSRIVSLPGAPAPIQVVNRILTGNGLQAELGLYGASGLFTGTITSNQPDRVRLSFEAKAPGSAQLTTSTSPRSGTVYVQGFASQGTATLTFESADGRKADTTVFLFPSTMALRPPTSSYVSDTNPVLSMDQPLSSKDFALDARPSLVDADTGKLIMSSALSIRGGTDPAFVRAQSSDTTVIEPAPPDALVSEGDATGRLNFRVNATGDVVLSASQPEGFIEVPDSSLRMHVYERQLVFNATPVLSADLQMPITVVPLGSNTGSGVNVTLTSLDPDRLRISSDGSTTGEATITVPLGKAVYLQALSTAVPGDAVRVRLEAPGYASAEREVQFVAAELRMDSGQSPLSLKPLVNSSFSLKYGPLDELGQISSRFSWGFRPGVRLPLRISSSDTSIVGVSTSSVTLDTYLRVSLLPVAPGHAQIHIDVPAQITNRVATLDAVVGLFEFPSISMDAPTRYLVTKFTITNPRPQPTAVSVSGTGAPPLRFGTAASGAGAPSAGSLQLTLAAKENRSLYLEPAGSGSFSTVNLEAPDFAPASNGTYIPDPQVRFEPGSLVNVSLTSGTSPVAIVLVDRNSRELPLGTAFGPLKLQLESSKPQVVRVPAASVEFAPGESRKNVVLELLGRGDAVVSLTVPAGFADAVSVRQDLVVSVR